MDEIDDGHFTGTASGGLVGLLIGILGTKLKPHKKVTSPDA